MSGEAEAGAQKPQAANWRALARIAFALFGVSLAAALLARTLSQTSLADLRAALAEAAPMRIIAALGFAAASYFCLTLFDWLGARYAGHPLRWRKAAQASFVALSLGHNIGFAAVSSGALRYRFYARWGLEAQEVARLIAFCAATVGLGLCALAGVALLLAPRGLEALGFAPAVARGFGLGLLLVCALWIVACAFWRARISLRGWRLYLPTPRLALAQTVVGAINFACVAACLHQALRAFAPADYLHVAAAYAAANAATLVSHAPGGLGVIETVVSALVPGPRVLAALVLFRCAYFFAPLTLGLALLAWSEWRLRAR